MMNHPVENTPWTHPDWFDEASRWIHDELARQGIEVMGPIEQPHQQPWSTVLRIPTTAGDLYFKASAKIIGHESAVTQALSQWQPEAVPQVLQIEAGRGWMLMVDGGQRMREAFQTGLDVGRWAEMLAAYAALQMALAPRVNALLALGLRDRRLGVLPSLYEWLLADEAWLLLDQPDGITGATYHRLVEMVPQVQQMCDQLAAYGVPASVHHNDLHDGNIFMKDGRYLFFDWGDSSIAHPFFSLRTVFVSIENTFGLEEDDPLFDELARAYLRPWAQAEAGVDLWAAYLLARKLWSLSSAVKYKTMLSPLGASGQEYAGVVPALLTEFLLALE